MVYQPLGDWRGRARDESRERRAPPDKGKHDLPPEGTQTQKPVEFDLDKAAMLADQPEEERPPEEPAPIPQRRAPREPKHFLALRCRKRGRLLHSSCHSS